MISWTRLLGGQDSVSGELLQERIRFQPGCIPVVVWNLTTACNLRCRHCYMEAERDRHEDELDEAAAMKVLKDLQAAGVRIVLFSGGEPLLRPDLFSLIEQARSLGLRPVLSTNGALIDEGIAERLQRSGCAYVGVSVDGLAETHDAFRGARGAFQRTMEGLRMAKEVGLLTGIRFTLTSDNVQDLSPLLDLVESEGIPRFCLYHLVYAGRGKLVSGLDVDNPTRREVAESLFQRAESWVHGGRGGQELLSVDNHADGLYIVLRLGQMDAGRARKAWALLSRQMGCPAGCKIACIDPKGWVHPCQFWPHWRVGQVREAGFGDLWESLEGSPLRERKSKLLGRCGRCRHQEVCGGCRVRAEHQFHDPWAEDPACYLTDQEISQSMEELLREDA